MIIENGSLIHPSTHKVMLGGFGWFNASADSDRAKERRTGEASGRNVMTPIVNRGPGPRGSVARNCAIAYANSPAIAVDSSGSFVEGCYKGDVRTFTLENP